MRHEMLNTKSSFPLVAQTVLHDGRPRGDPSLETQAIALTI